MFSIHTGNAIWEIAMWYILKDWHLYQIFSLNWTSFSILVSVKRTGLSALYLIVLESMTTGKLDSQKNPNSPITGFPIYALTYNLPKETVYFLEKTSLVKISNAKFSLCLIVLKGLRTGPQRWFILANMNHNWL